jgi:hypothetical protein
MLPEYKRVADVHKETGVNSMLYFEMSFRERKDKILPKNFDQYVYIEMHDWLKHKPTMNPPHFRGLLSPTNANYMIPPISAETGNGVPLKDSASDGVLHTTGLHAYSSAATYDVAVHVLDDSEETPHETEASDNGNRTVPSFPSPRPPSASAATFHAFRTCHSAGHSRVQVNAADLNAMGTATPGPQPRSIPSSPLHGPFRSPSHSRPSGAQGSEGVPREGGPL